MRAAALVVELLELVAGPFLAVAVPAVPAHAALIVSAVASVVVVVLRHGDTVRAAALAVEPLGLVAGPFVAVAVPGVPARAALLVLVISVVASFFVAVFGRGDIVRAATIAVEPLGVVAGPFVAVTGVPVPCPNGWHILRERKEEGGKSSLRPSHAQAQKHWSAER